MVFYELGPQVTSPPGRWGCQDVLKWHFKVAFYMARAGADVLAHGQVGLELGFQFLIKNENNFPEIPYSVEVA